MTRFNAYYPLNLLKNDSKINLRIYDVLGNEIGVLLKDEFYNSGHYDYVFNATTYHLKPGVYYYELNSEEYKITKKMVVN